MKSAEIKELTVAELAERIDAEKANLVRLKVNHKISPVESSAIIKKLRRDVARMLTILRQKQNS